jgi:hypothetical protein
MRPIVRQHGVSPHALHFHISTCAARGIRAFIGQAVASFTITSSRWFFFAADSVCAGSAGDPP